jgi:hypothetical protein
MPFFEKLRSAWDGVKSVGTAGVSKESVEQVTSLAGRDSVETATKADRETMVNGAAKYASQIATTTAMNDMQYLSQSAAMRNSVTKACGEQLGKGV